jgi:hypothetical protein
MTDVDVLSRHVGTVTHGNLLDRENVFREQTKDAFSQKRDQERIVANRIYF